VPSLCEFYPGIRFITEGKARKNFSKGKKKLSQSKNLSQSTVKMEQTECSETSACTIQTPGNYPEESIQHSEHGESLKSRKPQFNFPSFHIKILEPSRQQVTPE
jgi:hypothetical protein